ncbi:hypothetical protein BvCmsOUNP023_01179 [Escherichia coli]|nr:hypothetical protein BvCmsOUNP023_01179 [Escherichia coli]
MAQAPALVPLPFFIRFIKCLLRTGEHVRRRFRTTDIQNGIPHRFERLSCFIRPGFQRPHVLFQAAGLVIKAFRGDIVRRL